MPLILLRGGPWDKESVKVSDDARVYYDHARDPNVRYVDSGEIDQTTGRRIFDFKPDPSKPTP
jgi:hypothetical protein